jgi:hypothetical protein
MAITSEERSKGDITAIKISDDKTEPDLVKQSEFNQAVTVRDYG